MTHYTVDYTGKTDAEALKDLREWLGEERFVNLNRAFVGMFQNGKLTEKQFALMMSFTGVSGKPVSAFYQHIVAQVQS